MGSGKSYWAHQLATALDVPLIEMDEEIARAEGKSIPEIFSLHGAAYFRELEHKKLQEVIGRDAFVLSTGGGVPCFFDHMEVMNREGLTVWLNTSMPVLVTRLKIQRERRPLIRNLNDEALQAFVLSELEARRSFYARARLIVDPDEETLETLLYKIQSCKDSI